MAVYNVSGGQNVHIDVVLTNMSIGFPNLGYVGPVLFPTLKLKKQSDKYYIFGRELFTINPGGDLRAAGTVANEIPGLQVSLDSYFAVEHALQIPVTDEERQNADSPLSPDADGAMLVTTKVWLQREVAMQTLATTTANYPSDHVVTLAGTTQWSAPTTSDPILDIRIGKAKINSKLFLNPNVAIIPYQVMTALEDHPKFIERIKYSERGIITPEIITGMLGIGKIVIPGLGLNTGNPNQAVTLSYLWGKDVLLAYVPSGPGMKVPAYGYEFVWGYPQEQVVDRWREEPRKSDLIRVSRRYDLKLTALDANNKSIAGYLIKAAVA